MERIDTGSERPASRPRSIERAEVAGLAAKIAQLPHDGPPLADREAAGGRPGTSPRRRSRIRRWSWWMIYFIAWMATLGLGVVAALRIFYHDGNFVLTCLNAFTRYVYLPAYLCLIWAVWQRRWALALAGSCVVLCHVAWMAPSLLPDRRFDAPAAAAAGSPPIRIFFANVLLTNRNCDAILQEIASVDPDIIVVAEWGSLWHKAFVQLPLAADYVHGLSLVQPRYGQVNVFSKLPLEREMQNWVTGRLVRTIDVQLGSQTLRIIALHAPRPMHLSTFDYFSYWNQMIPVLATENGPLVVVGDFNATQHSLVYDRLQALGLRSAHDDRGRGYATTWPNDTVLPALIRIDQAFLSPEVECQRIAEGQGLGSDHKPLIFEVRVRESVHRAAADQAESY